MATLPTNYLDPILNTEVNTRKRYNLIENVDGTISFEEVTTYTQTPSKIGAGAFNTQNTEINALAAKGNNMMSNCILEMPTKPTYSGSNITVYVGTKFLIPNGRNTDGTLKSTEKTLPANYTAGTVTTEGVLMLDASDGFSKLVPSKVKYINKYSELPAPTVDSATYYCSETNFWYRPYGDTTVSWITAQYCPLGSYIRDVDGITSLTTNDVFRFADYNDVNALNNSLTTLGTETLIGTATSTSSSNTITLSGDLLSNYKSFRLEICNATDNVFGSATFSLARFSNNTSRLFISSYYGTNGLMEIRSSYVNNTSFILYTVSGSIPPTAKIYGIK